MILNSKKCKEMIIDFRKTKTEIPELQAEKSPISRVSSYRLLGVWIDNNLKWETITWALIKKGRKRLYFLKILKNYGVLTKDLLAFYNSIIRSVLEYGDDLWSGCLTAKQRCNIERIQKRAFRIIYPGQDYQWRNYYWFRPGEPGGPQPKWGPPGWAKWGPQAQAVERKHWPGRPLICYNVVF
jgi:hypothetical protein